MLTHVIFTILCVFCLRFRSEISERRRLLYLLWENDRHLLSTQWILMISNRKKINWISSEMTLMALRLSSSLWLNKTNDTTRMAREKDWKKSRTKSDNVIKFKERHQVEMGRDDDDVSGVHIQKKGEIIGKLILSLYFKAQEGKSDRYWQKGQKLKLFTRILIETNQFISDVEWKKRFDDSIKMIFLFPLRTYVSICF